MRLRITKFGESAEGIQLTGDPKSCEPDHVRIAFPGGDVEVVRASDGLEPDYWVHIRVNRDGCAMVSEDDMKAGLCDARLDIVGKDVSKTNTGDFSNPELYHLAVRVRPEWKGGSK